MHSKKRNAVLVSIIIPVYNVDKYLKRCVNSALKQTHLNLDIILVNDGSTDESGEICDRFARIDQRVRVVHKANGGLSDARNAGLKIAKGAYVNFLDSDDFISLDAIEFLLDSVLVHQADIATVGYVNYYSEEAMASIENPVANEQLVLSVEDALERLLYQNGVTTSACMKLFKRSLFDSGIRFPVGKVCEDLAVIYKLFSRSKTIVINSVHKYYYFQREGSIMQSNFKRSRMDGFYFAKEQLDFISRNYPRLTKAAQYRLFLEAVYILMYMPLNPSEYKDERKAVSQIVKKHKKMVSIDSKANAYIRQGALVSYLGSGTMAFYYKTRIFAGHSLKRVKS